MNRRAFTVFLAGTAAAWSLAARAQQPEKTIRIGLLWRAASAEQEGSNFKSLVKGISDLGRIEGREISLEHRFANDMPERFKSMADNPNHICPRCRPDRQQIGRQPGAARR